MAWGARLSDALRLDGTAAWVEGRRTDAVDNLYRVAPASATVALSRGEENFKWTFEGVFYAAGGDLSKSIVFDEPRSTNDETPAFGLFNISARWKTGDGSAFTVGIENVFDNATVNHLSGFNRVGESGVGVGDRLPGPGRSFFARLVYAW